MSNQDIKILLVDDAPSNLDVLIEALRPEGYTCLAAPSGDAALAIVAQILPDLILLDILMPIMDGLECCRRLKANPETKEIPIIFITAHREVEALTDAFQAGGVDYITKPFRTPEVVARVATHLRIHNLTRELWRKNKALEIEIAARAVAESSLKRVDQHLAVVSQREIERWGLTAFVGRSESFRRLILEIRRIQSSASTSVMILGESGTGKDLDPPQQLGGLLRVLGQLGEQLDR